MTLPRNSTPSRTLLPFSRNATPCKSLGCQSEVTMRNEFTESQRDAMRERANQWLNFEGWL